MIRLNLVGLFLISILIRIPNIYIFPIDSPLFLTNNIARFLCIFFIASNIYKWDESPMKKASFSFVIVYFISQSLSILVAQNHQSFLAVFKDIIFGILFYVLGYLLIDKKSIKSVPFILFSSVFINLILEAFLYSKSYIGKLIELVMNEKYLYFFNYQAARNRYFGDSLNEAFLPIFFYIMFLSTKKSPILKVLSGIALILSIFLTIIASWRTKFIIMVFSMVLSIVVILIKKGRDATIFTITFATLILFSASLFATFNTQRNIFVRLLEDDAINMQADTSRKNFLYEAVSLGMSSPFLGVGLGNYYDGLTAQSKTSKKSKNADMYREFILIDDPHNLLLGAFATSGTIGLLALLAMLIRFMTKDYYHILHSRGDPLAVVLIITFWSIFIYAFFNPWLYFAYLSTFWFIRGIVEKYQSISSKNE